MGNKFNEYEGKNLSRATDKKEWKSGHKQTFFPNNSGFNIFKSGWNSFKYSDSQNRAELQIWI